MNLFVSVYMYVKITETHPPLSHTHTHTPLLYNLLTMTFTRVFFFLMIIVLRLLKWLALIHLIITILGLLILLCHFPWSL